MINFFKNYVNAAEVDITPEPAELCCLGRLRHVYEKCWGDWDSENLIEGARGLWITRFATCRKTDTVS